MPKKSSKTAHVLNLLTTEAREDAQESAVTERRRGTDPVPADAVAPTRPKIQIENGAPGPLSDLLRSELEKEFVPAGYGEDRSATAGDALLTENESEEMKKLSDELMNQEKSEYIAVNIVEDVIKSKAYAFMERLGGCVCYRCVNDVIALALNALPPQYTVTHKGMLFAKVAAYENQHTADITAALTRACLSVKSHPRH